MKEMVEVSDLDDFDRHEAMVPDLRVGTRVAKDCFVRCDEEDEDAGADERDTEEDAGEDEDEDGGEAVES